MSILEKKIQKMLVSDLEAIISNEKTLNELFGIPASNFEQTWERLTNSEPPTTPMTLKPIVGAPTNDPSPDFQVESLKMENLYQLMLKHPAGIARRLGPEGMVIILEYIVSRFVPDAPDFDDESVTLERAKNLEVKDVERIKKIGEFVEQVAKNPEGMLQLAMKVMGRELPSAEEPTGEPTGEPEQAKPEKEKEDPQSLKNQDQGNINKALNQLRNKGISDKDMVKQFDDAVERIIKNAGPYKSRVRKEDVPTINKIRDEIVKILKGDFSNLVKESKNDPIHNMAQVIVEKVFKIVSSHNDMNMFDIKNDSDRPLDGLMKVLSVFLPWAQKELGFDRAVKIRLISDKDNEKNPMGFTGHYNPGTDTVSAYVDGRHPKDILRSISHELVHHNQNCNGKLAQMQYTGPGYAQKDKVGKECEDEAYLIGNGRLVRTFGDTIWKNISDMREVKENKMKRRLIRENLELLRNIDAILGQKFTNSYDRSEALKAAIDSEQDPTKRQELEDLEDKHDDYISDAIMDVHEMKTIKEFDDQEAYSMIKKKCSEEHKGDLAAIKKCMEDEGMGPRKENKTMDKVEEKKKFPDLTGDGKVTQADILKGRGVDLDDEESDEKDEQNEGKGEECKKCGRPKGTDEGHCPGKRDDANEGHCPGKRDDMKESIDPVKRHAALRHHATGRKEKDLFNKLMEKWCK